MEQLDSEYNKRKLVACRDEAGVGLLHKAVYYDHQDIVEWLVHNYPQLVHQRDSLGRTPLHYACWERHETAAAAALAGAGAARGARDAAGAPPGRARTRPPLPTVSDMARDNHRPYKGLVIKRHNIRIWCHECDMARLQRAVWEGHGGRLLTEVSNQPTVRKFLEAVPYIMNTIREIHSAVVHNKLEELMKHAGDPVPPQALSSRDVNHMTVMHKAAGLGHVAILKYLTDRYPQGINDTDDEGRTPLHYAAAVRDDQHTYNTLVGLGADETVVDNKNKTPAYYLNKQQEIDKHLLKTIPDAPRTASSSYPPSWDWKLLDAEVITELHKKSRRKPKASHENGSSTNNTISESTRETRMGGMKNSSTHELIKGLPELDDFKKSQEDVSHTKEPDIDEETNQTETNDVAPPENSEPVEENGEVSAVDDIQENNVQEADATETENEKEDKEAENIENNDIESKVDDEADKPTEEGTETEDVDQDEVNDNNGDDVDETQTNNNEDENKDHDEETNHGEENVNKINETEGNEIEDGQEGIPQEEATDDGDEVKENGSIDETENNEDMKEENKDGKNVTEPEEDPDTVVNEGNETNGRNIQENLIEGIVSAEAEMDSQDASVNEREESIEGEVLVVDNEIDPEVTELINSANMEMLAALVLNGEGLRLVGRQSRNLELQAFLNNVPTYMKKINKVHIAAREGNIRDLQAALDRRKFAIARDSASPNGATPLHVATVFGKTNIMKYLGGRFPETLSAVDFEGRSALHYAAVLPDNGHYYMLLQQLGANSKDLDDNGRSAEDYHNDPSLLPFDSLVSDFGISEETVQDMLSDKVPEDRVSSRRFLDIPEALDTLERCYRLLSSARPSRTPLSASSNRATPPLFLGRFLKRPTFDLIKYRITRLDHDLFDVIWPAVKKLPENRNIIQTVEEDFPGGITAPDYYVYSVFHEFLIPLIKDLHNMNVHCELLPHPQSNFERPLTSSTSTDPLIELNIDRNDDFVLSGSMECMRNISGYELPLNLTIGQLEDIERIITNVLMQDEFTKISQLTNPDSEPEPELKGGNYYTLNEVLEKPSEICAFLASAGLLVALCEKEEIDDSLRLHGRYWPYGRGVFVSDDKTLAVWINVHDHLRVLTSTPQETPGEIGLPFSRLANIMSYLHKHLSFIWDEYLGHLSSRPNYLGAGIHFNLIINFPGLSKDADNMKHLCAMRGLQYRETLSADIARVSNYQCLSVTESNCFNDFSTAVSNLLHLERDLTLSSNSAHIATMLSNIFKRKRSSIVDLESPGRTSNK
ncbi:uncharacterized protein LOC105393377 isoform X1 [Plutella xylostella]|uniref:uncharacterized protein LOC105393377 isoform X1 n=1 Tax=Plutella xylostella TaxID=51655 RepID=UPI00203232B8|nr:uncharacterized protein LOC105393377 isoform X1 [Plutella xylostella]